MIFLWDGKSDKIKRKFMIISDPGKVLECMVAWGGQVTYCSRACLHILILRGPYIKKVGAQDGLGEGGGGEGEWRDRRKLLPAI